MPEKLTPGKFRRSLAITGSAALIGAAALGGNEIYRQRNDDGNRTNPTQQSTDLNDIISNRFVEGANDFDHEQVRKDAEEYPLWPEFAAIPRPIDPLVEANPENSLLDHVSNDLVAGANEYDHDRIGQLAAGFQLDPEFENVPDPRIEKAK